MRTIRQGTFETNSSSMHSLVINNDYYYGSSNPGDKSRIMNAKFKDFSYRNLVPHTDPEDKFSFVWMLFCGLIDLPISKKLAQKQEDEEYERTKWSRSYLLSDDCPDSVRKEHNDFVKKHLNKKDYKYDKFELVDVENKFKKFLNALDKVNEKFSNLTSGYLNNSVTFNFDDLKLEVHNDYGYSVIGSKSEITPSTGTYGNDVVIDFFSMRDATDAINKFINSDEKVFDLDRNYCVESCFRSMLGFAYDDKSIFIQDTDEHGDEDAEEHKRLVKEYFLKGDCEGTVLRPIGG